MKTKSKFRRAIIRNEIDKKLANYGVPVPGKMQPTDKIIKAATSKATE